MRQMIIFAIKFTLILGISACHHKENDELATAPPVEVGVITAAASSQSIKVELPARVAAYLEAEVRPQVTGIILKRSFDEGGFVKKGQSLYQIDPAPYQASLMNAKAELQSAKAVALAAKLTAERYKSLLADKAISQQDYDEANADYQEALAQIQVQRANVNMAEINLQYTQVYAPISGRIGKSSVTEGALVTESQTDALVSIQQIDPIYVDLSQSSSQLLHFKDELKQGALQSSYQNNVQLIMHDATFYQGVGSLKFIDVNVDPLTDSVILRAEFANPEHELLPGMYVRGLLNVGVDKQAILVPQRAVTHNSKGQAVVMLVNEKNRVESRVITTAEVIDNQWRVKDGLKVGDRIIVTGLQKIRAGSKVSTVEANIPRAEAD